MPAPASIQVVLPALNEEATIGNVVRELRAAGLSRIRVVDNGSRDATAALAAQAGADVIAEPRRGYGQACWTGTRDLPPEVEWILFADADGSDDPADLPKMLAAADTSGADLVLGDRRATPAGRAVLTPIQNFGNALATTLICLGWGHPYHDLGPLRLVRRSLFEAAQMRDRSFGWTIELQVRAVELGAKIVELPVHYRPRQGGQSKISGTLRGSFRAGTIILTTLGQLALRQVSPRLGWAAALVLLGCALWWPLGEARAATVPWFLAAAAVVGLGFALTWQPGQRSPAAPDATVAATPTRGPPALLFWVVAVVARLLLVPMAPGDDVWRYLWEGALPWHGASPYLLAPNADTLAPLRAEWWAWINHPGVTTIYPPVIQLVFATLAGLCGDSVTLWKLAFVGADLLLVGLLAGRWGRARALWWAWNPLVLYVTAGGAHFESLFLLPLVAGVLLAEAGRWRWAAVAVGLSIGVKWLSAPVLLWWAVREWRRPVRAVAIVALGLVPLGLAAAAYLWLGQGQAHWWPVAWVEKARHLDFLPWLGELLLPLPPGDNRWLVVPAGLLTALVLWRAPTLWQAAEGFFLVLLLCLPSVHPWYFVWLLPWAVASGRRAALWVSLSAFAYFWVWRTFDLNGRWEISLAERLLVWLPLVFGWLADLWKGPPFPRPN